MPAIRAQAGAASEVCAQGFALRFFFEIVARGGYMFLGAPNAPIWLAAQPRFMRHPEVPRR